MARHYFDDPTRCATCRATDTPLRHPTIPDPSRPDMRVCVEDRPCFERFVALRTATR